jgi:hypothetical protein
MQTATAKIIAIQIETGGERSARIDCPPGLVPAPGAYLQARNPAESDSALAGALFPVGLDSVPVFTAAPIPPGWRPGAALHLRGPLGHGFNLPTAARRIALIALGETAARLLPLVPPALAVGADLALFTPASLLPDWQAARLPTALELYPLAALPEALAWADFLALDLPLGELPNLRAQLGFSPHQFLPCPAQALITLPMPCAGVGECGACAISLRRGGTRLACHDGPVFDLKMLEW